jgi:tyrosinase
VDAAKTLRIPYWDWVKTATLPTVVTLSSISVNKPTGQATIANPLYTYKFPTRPSTSDFPDQSQAPQSYLQTVRTPDANGNSNHAAINAALKQNAGYLHDTTYMILTRPASYAEFASNGYPGTIQGYGSLENPHGTVHNLVGGSGGHMTYLDYSGFDPIFWLHHANVDRLIAIWQAINPDAFNISQLDNSGTFSITAGTTETQNTPLGPFHRDNTSTALWTSTQARGTRDFGYTYPELKTPWNITAAQLQTNAKAAVRALYDPSGALGRRSKLSVLAHLNTRDTPPLDPVRAIQRNGSYTQWALNLHVNKFAHESSFNIFVFVGEPSPDANKWPLDSSLVGTYPVLRQPGAPTSDLTIYGTIPLTRQLLAANSNGKIKNLQPTPTAAYLKKNLHWRLADVTTGKEIKIEDVPSLRFFVVGQDVTPADSPTSFPTYGKAIPYKDITAGKAGGLEQNESYGVGGVEA